MAFPLSEQSPGVSTTSPAFDGNYKRLRKLINKALKEGTPLQNLHLIPKNPSQPDQKFLLRNDLLNLLGTIRKIRINYQERWSTPVPPELVRDIRAKTPEQRLPWEEEALDKANQWEEEVKVLRVLVRKELNDSISREFFQTDQ
jgi:hypothetical protein